ncbi:MAG: hypothetical protein RSC48_08800 [Anaerorhabdus sp.]
MDLDIIFNNETGRDHGVFLYDIPIISSSNESYTSTNIAGKRGASIVKTGAIENITISCTFTILNKMFIPNLRDIKGWLRGKGKLVFSETSDTFYDVLFVEHKEVERELLRFGKFTVTFICYPFEFLDSGDTPQLVNQTIQNYQDESYPEYIIEGEGACALSVNGNEIRANIGQNLIIDTRRLISYRKNGGLMNTAVIGRYSDLHLNHGNNRISITDGFTLMVIPHWGWNA